jgi:hypothetical protein
MLFTDDQARPKNARRMHRFQVGQIETADLSQRVDDRSLAAFGAFARR